MTILSLEDPRWTEMKSGYRLEYDARPLLRRFATGEDLESCWDELWNELYHQGDVDTASYAVLPHLVSIFSDKERDWNLYAFAAAVAAEAGEDKNPPVPDYMRAPFRVAIDCLFDLALTDIEAELPLIKLRAVLSFLACRKGAEALSRALMNIDLFEDYGEEVLKAEKNG